MAVRTFEKLSAAGWLEVNVHKLAGGDTIRVLDDAVVTGFAADALNGDPLTYVVAQVQQVVTVPVTTATGTREQVIGFTG